VSPLSWWDFPSFRFIQSVKAAGNTTDLHLCRPYHAAFMFKKYNVKNSLVAVASRNASEQATTAAGGVTR
jgi:hypothetical protein